MSNLATTPTTLSSGPGVPMCTVRRHPDGGWTPVLHPAALPAPDPAPHAMSFPDVSSATRYARNHYGSLHIAVQDDTLHAHPA